MDFAKDWIQKIFETPREHIGEKSIEEDKGKAFLWLQENFGATTNRTARGGEENRAPFQAV